MLNLEDTIGGDTDSYRRALEGSTTLYPCSSPEVSPTGEIRRHPVDRKAAPTILVVDDQAPNRELLQDILVDRKFKVLTAPDGAAGLHILGETKIDLVLLDVLMPGVSGFEVCRRLKAENRTREIPVIFITGLSEAAAETKGRQMGAIDYISKPFHPAQLRVGVDMHLNARRRGKANSA